MKKCTIVLMIIVIVATSTITVQAEIIAVDASTKVKTHYALLDGNGQAVLPDVSSLCWPTENGLFFLHSGTKPLLFYWTLGQNEVELIHEISFSSLGKWRTIGQEKSNYPRDESIVFSLADGLYGLILNTGEVKRYDIHENEWAYVGTLLVKGELIDDLDIEMIKDVVRDGDVMYFLIDFIEGIALLQLELSTGTCTILPDTCFHQIEPNTPGTLLVSLNGNLHVYDPHAQTLGAALVSVDPLSSAFAYDQGTDRLLFIRYGDVYQKDKDESIEMIRVTEIRNENPSWDEDVQNVYGNAPVSFLMPLSDGSIAYHTSKLEYESNWGDPYNFLYVVYQEPIVDTINTLHLASGFSVATAFYQLTHPNVRIERCIVDSGGHKQEDDHFPDVFSCTVETRTALPLYARELMDLSQSPIISEIVSQYDQKVKEAICEGEKIIGLPWSISLNTLDYDKEKWESIGLPDPPKTVDELFELINLWAEKYASQYPDQSLLGNGGFSDLRYGAWAAVTEAYVNAYASSDAPVNFDTDEYRALIQRIVDIPDVKYSEWGALFRFFMGFDSLFYPFTLLDWKDGYTEYINIPPLTLSNEQPLRIRSDLYYLCIPQDAQAPELALDYVTFLAKFQLVYQPEITFMMTGGVDRVSDVYGGNRFFDSLPFVGMTSEGLSVLPYVAPGGFLSNESLDFYRSIFLALDFDILGSNPAYVWGDPGMRLPWPTDEPDGDIICTVDELIAKMNKMSEQYFSYK